MLLRQEQDRRDDVTAIPTYTLEARHCAGAHLLSNRAALLTQMPLNGVVAELGADEGNFSAAILETTKPEMLHLVDVWGTERYGDQKANAVKGRFKSEINAGRVQIKRKLSTEAAGDFADDYFDWIYIDTDHSYKTTLSELYAYAGKVKQDGFIAGHDYTMGNWVTGYKYGVIEAVAEFCVKENWRIAFLTAGFGESNSFAIKRI
ncbi:class I SAM-dependent methyltransferase [uncultured Tateyamaria sp.]|uniref:class I SAM-dependent methyltransferase n=1 Tax=uncultured Tateyamaria sp. TaxID=455651 RepID=UPI00261B40EE|nr:class I SAM-dependent methyltransferase [uncultured Tateyamaria sp.]